MANDSEAILHADEQKASYQWQSNALTTRSEARLWDVCALKKGGAGKDHAKGSFERTQVSLIVMNLKWEHEWMFTGEECDLPNETVENALNHEVGGRDDDEKGDMRPSELKGKENGF